MQIHAAQLMQSPIGTTRDYEVSETVHITVDDADHLVQGHVKLTRTQRSILAKSALNTEVELFCSRCLSKFNSPLAVNFEEEFMPTVDIINGLPLPLPGEESSFTIDDHHVIDLTEAICQYALLAAPMKPLCRNDCDGLCQKCGHNLNKGPCACPAQEIDPRWSELIKLL